MNHDVRTVYLSILSWHHHYAILGNRLIMNKYILNPCMDQQYLPFDHLPLLTRLLSYVADCVIVNFGGKTAINTGTVYNLGRDVK